MIKWTVMAGPTDDWVAKRGDVRVQDVSVENSHSRVLINVEAFCNRPSASTVVEFKTGPTSGDWRRRLMLGSMNPGDVRRFRIRWTATGMEGVPAGVGVREAY